MKMVSIDSSTRKTGVASWEDGELADYQLLDVSDITDTAKRMDSMSIAIITVLDLYNPDIVWIEETWSAANVETTKKLTMILGIVYAWCLIHKKEFHSVLPSQWRSWVGLPQGKKKRKELKEMDIEYVSKTYKLDVPEDVADAICVGAGVLNYYDLLAEE